MNTILYNLRMGRAAAAFVAVCALYIGTMPFANAQIGGATTEQMKALKLRTLLVVIEEPNTALLDHLTPEERTIYTDDITAYNAAMQTNVQAAWKFCDKVLYKTRDEVNALIATDKLRGTSEYAYLEFSKYAEQFSTAASFRQTVPLHDRAQLYSATLPNPALKVSRMDIRLVESIEELPLYAELMPSPFPTRGELLLALKQLQNQLDYRLRGMSYADMYRVSRSSGAKLQTYTLLLDKEWCSNEIAPEGLKTQYYYPFQIVAHSRIEEVLTHEEEKTAIVQCIPISEQAVVYKVYDPKSGIELAKTFPEQFAALDSTAKGRLKLSHIRDFAKAANR